LLEQELQWQPRTPPAQWIEFQADDAPLKNSKVAVAGMAYLENLECPAYQEPTRNDIQSQNHPVTVMGKLEGAQK
jgi:hypothetical protein